MFFISETNEPVYRGVKADCIDLNNYRPGSIGFWPAFSSTSKFMNIAQRFSKMTAGGNPETIAVFQIYLSPESAKVATNIDLPKNWSFYNEGEVVLLPFFCFQVVQQKEEVQDEFKIIKITLVEIPGQDLLSIRQITFKRLIWADMDMSSKENQNYKRALSEQFEGQGFSTAETIDELFSLVNETYFTNALISGRFAKVVIPHIHHLEHVRSFIIFCWMEDHYKEWVKENKFKKVVLVTRDFGRAMEECKKQNAKTVV